MKPPLFVRKLTEDELHTLDKALRSNESFTVRRAQILRLSNQRQLITDIPISRPYCLMNFSYPDHRGIPVVAT